MALLRSNIRRGRFSLFRRAPEGLSGSSGRAKSHRDPLGRRLTIEPLEDRRLLSAIPVPNGSFESTLPGLVPGVGFNYNTGCTLGTTTGTVSGWSVTDIPVTGGVYQAGGWGPTAGVEIGIWNGTAGGPNWGNGMAPDGGQFLMLNPGEPYNTVPKGPFAQPGASMSATTTGISASAAAGTTYVASYSAANVEKWGYTVGSNSNLPFAPVGANMTLNILANGVVVASQTVAGSNFTENDADDGSNTGNWFPVTASWTADASHAGQSIQLQIVATNFLEDQYGVNGQWTLPIMGIDDVSLAAMTAAGQGHHLVGGAGCRRALWQTPRTLSATLMAGGDDLPNEFVAFTINGKSVGDAATNAIGVATLMCASLAGLPAARTRATLRPLSPATTLIYAQARLPRTWWPLRQRRP